MLPLALGGMKNQTPTKCHFESTVRSALKEADNRCRRGCGEIGTILCGGERQNEAAAWKPIWLFFSALSTEWPHFGSPRLHTRAA